MQQPAKQPRLRFATFAAALTPPALMVGTYMLGVLAGWWPSMPGLRLWLIPWALLSGGLAIWGLRWAPTLMLTGVLGLGLFVFAIAVNFKAVRVEGNSMLPTLQPGDVLLVDLTNEQPLPGGIYVLDVEEEQHNPLIKRLVGVPGETIDVRYGRVVAGNSEVYPRDGTPSDTWNETRPAERHFRVPKTLADGEYFFLGDNPPESRDSRQFGPVKQQAVEGRAVWSLRGSHGFGPLR